MYEIKSEKNKLRSTYTQIRDKISPEDKALLDRRICERITSLVSYRFADTILLYAPIKSEVNILPIAEAALKAGKRIAFPRCIPKRSQMVFHYINSTDELFSQSYSIPEPREDAPVFDKSVPHSRESCLCLIPALIYDRNGYRIGYGKGYYDRYLRDFKGSKAGIVYNCCFIDSVPHGKFDLKVDFIVSERGVSIIK